MKRMSPIIKNYKWYLISILVVAPMIAGFSILLHTSEKEQVCRARLDDESRAIIPGILNGTVIVEVGY